MSKESPAENLFIFFIQSLVHCLTKIDALIFKISKFISFSASFIMIFLFLIVFIITFDFGQFSYVTVYPFQYSKPRLRKNENLNSTIKDAITFLHLPKKKSSISCDDPDSIITCNQILKAYHTISHYEKRILETPIENQKYLLQNHTAGIANQLMYRSFCLLLAIISNRTLVIVPFTSEDKFSYKIKDNMKHPSAIKVGTESIPEIYQKYIRYQGDDFNSVSSISNSNISHIIMSDQKIIQTSDVGSTSFMYMNIDIASFAIEHFGLFAAYFLSNWMDQFYPNSTELARNQFNNIPVNTPVIGVHIRVYRLKSNFYIQGIDPTLNRIFPFVDAWIHVNKGVVAITTDSKKVIQKFSKRYKKKIFFLKTKFRGSDKSTFQSIVDLEILNHCDEILGTFRSTFSHIVPIRNLIPAYYYEKSSPTVWISSSSQIGSIVSFYEPFHFHWIVIDLVHLYSSKIDYLRLFYKFFLI